MFEFSYVGVADGGAVAGSASLSGSLSKTAAPSGGNVTSDTVIVTAPAGFVGMRTTDWSMTGTVTLQYQVNGGSFTAIVAEEPTSTIANNDTMAMRITGAGSGESLSFNLRDNTNTIVQAVTITAS